MNEFVAEWFKKANNDLVSAVYLFENIHPKQIEISAYLCQQCIEKTMKGFLVSKDVEPDRTHDLEFLCKKCEAYEDNFINFLSECKNITPFATQGRYPNNIEITEEQVKRALTQAKEIYDFCYQYVNRTDSTTITG